MLAHTLLRLAEHAVLRVISDILFDVPFMATVYVTLRVAVGLARRLVVDAGIIGIIVDAGNRGPVRALALHHATRGAIFVVAIYAAQARAVARAHFAGESKLIIALCYLFS